MLEVHRCSCHDIFEYCCHANEISDCPVLWFRTMEVHSQEFQTFCRKNDSKHIRCAPYHPASNGLAERAAYTLKADMKTLGPDRETRMYRFLSRYRVTPKLQRALDNRVLDKQTTALNDMRVTRSGWSTSLVLPNCCPEYFRPKYIWSCLFHRRFDCRPSLEKTGITSVSGCLRRVTAMQDERCQYRQVFVRLWVRRRRWMYKHHL